MAEAAVAAPLLRGLPDEIAIWEILVRLPPKDLLRCRAVCPAWRRATSSRDFLFAHHARQPTLSLLRSARQPTLSLLRSCAGGSQDFIPFDHRTGLAAADQLQSIARLGPDYFHPEASCDGLLVLSINATRFCICNPATRQYAPLPLLRFFRLGGMYLHPPTGEYRLLMNKGLDLSIGECAYHVYTIGSCQPPRRIGIPYDVRLMCSTISLMFHGSLHWYTGQTIMAFHTTTESFRQMRSPIDSGDADLFEIDDMLGMYGLNDEATIMDIWVMQDYEGEVWAFKHRVELPFAQITAQLQEFDNHWNLVVDSFDGDVLVLLRFGDWLLQVDTSGKLVASVHRKGLGPTQLRLKQTLVPHIFFPTLEGYVVNASPFS